MRLKILLRFPKPALLPWGYPEWLRGLAYTAMARGLPRVAQQLHEEGWSHPEGRRYKPLTYSWLHGLRPDRLGLWAEETATWWVSSPIPAVVEALALGLLPFIPGDLLKLALAAFLLPSAWWVVRNIRRE